MIIYLYILARNMNKPTLKAVEPAHSSVDDGDNPSEMQEFIRRYGKMDSALLRMIMTHQKQPVWLRRVSALDPNSIQAIRNTRYLRNKGTGAEEITSGEGQ